MRVCVSSPVHIRAGPGWRVRLTPRDHTSGGPGATGAARPGRHSGYGPTADRCGSGFIRAARGGVDSGRESEERQVNRQTSDARRRSSDHIVSMFRKTLMSSGAEVWSQHRRSSAAAQGRYTTRAEHRRVGEANQANNARETSGTCTDQKRRAWRCRGTGVGNMDMQYIRENSARGVFKTGRGGGGSWALRVTARRGVILCETWRAVQLEAAGDDAHERGVA